jgi:hypothetical protein
MKRLLLKVVVSGTVLMSMLGASAGITAVPAQAMDRVRCEIPGNYRIVCYNSTPYRVHLRLNIFTDNGRYTRYITILNYRKVVYSPSYVNRISWHWTY